MKTQKIACLLIVAVFMTLTVFGLSGKVDAKARLHFGLHGGGHNGYSGYSYRYHSPSYHYKKRYHSPRYYYKKRHHSPPSHYYRYKRGHPYRYDFHDRDEPNSSKQYRDDGRSYSGGDHFDYGQGWSYLAKGQAHSALSSFSAQAKRYPNVGLPKVGYALAKAMLHDTTTAVWAMRRALRYEPESLDRVPGDEDLQHRIGRLVDDFHHSGSRGYRSTDAAFMTASLAYIHGDYKLAHDAIGHVLKSGDRHASTRQLNQIIGRKSFRGKESGHLQNDHRQEPDNDY